MGVLNWIGTANKLFAAIRLFLILIAVVGLGVGGYFLYTSFASGLIKAKEVAADTGNFLSGKPTVNGAELGGSCNVGADCKGYVSAFNQQGGTACCNGRCTQTQKDFTNVWWCPNECKGWFAAPGGTCGPKRADGEACVDHAQCANWHGLGQQGSGCDGGRCVSMKKDWAGVWYIPSQCVGNVLKGKGSC
jgi:hypothetical protein